MLLSFAIVSSDGSEVVVARQQQRSVVSLRLPSGSEASNFNTVVRAVIIDVFGARASVDFTVTVMPMPLEAVAAQLNSSAFSSSPIGQQLAEAKSSGDVQSFAPLLLSTVQLLQAKANASAVANNNTGGDDSASREATQQNAEVRTLLLQSVQTLSVNTFATVDSMVQQAQMVTSLAANPSELNSDFRQVSYIESRALCAATQKVHIAFCDREL